MTTVTSETSRLTLDAVRAIADPCERAEAAGKLAAEATAQADDARAVRNLAALILIEPFSRAVARTNAARAKVMAAYDNGKIDHATKFKRLAKLLEERHRALEAAGVTIEPADLYKPLGISRGLFIRMMNNPRRTQEPVEMDDPMRVMLDARDEANRHQAVADEAREIRDEAARLLLDGSAGRQPLSNADVARLTGLSTARVAQLRYGGR